MFPHMYRVRPRKSEDRGSTEDIAKPEWQTDGWRRNSRQWPPASPDCNHSNQPPLQAHNDKMADHPDDSNKTGVGANPWRANRRARSNSPAVTQKYMPPVPSTPKDRILQEETGLKLPGGQRTLRARSSSPYLAKPEDKQEVANSSSTTASPRIRRRRPEASMENPETETCDSAEVRHRLPRQRPTPENLPKVDHSAMTRTRSHDPIPTPANEHFEVRNQISDDLPETIDKRETIPEDLPKFEEPTPMIIPEELPQPSDTIKRSATPQTVCNGFGDPKPGLHFEISNREEDASKKPSTEAETPQAAGGAVSPETANQWKDLIDEALLTHEEELEDPSKNAFFQSETNPELFQGSAASYIPASKQDFLKQQQKEDEEYILKALDQEKDQILQPIITELVEEKKDSQPPEDLGDGRENSGVDVKSTQDEDADDEGEDERAWSPGPPIFKNDIQQLKTEDIGERWWEMEQPKPTNFKKEGTSVPKAPPPPGPPPPPPPMGAKKVGPSNAMPKLRKANVDNIKKAVRTRPDWHQLMKDLEGGIKLRKVSTENRNDRSKPILPGSRGRNGKFVYESEKPTIVNELLHEIQRGVKLRKARTDDRSKPDFNKLGLKKFKRQLTVEEKKKVKPEDPENLPSSSDDEEDIDHMRDDLDAVRTQLNDEIKKTKKLEREKKVMRIDIEALQAEVKKCKRQLKEAGIQEKPLEDGILPKLEKSMSKLRMSEKEDVDFGELDTIETEIKELNTQIDIQKKRAEGLEHKVYDLEQKLRISDGASDEWEGRAIFFEKKFKALQKDQGIALPDIAMASVQTEEVEFVEPEPAAEESKMVDSFGQSARKSGSRRSFASQINRMESFQEEEEDSSSSSSESEYEEEEIEEEEEEDETIAEGDSDAEPDEDKERRRAENLAKRLERDRVYWTTKLDHTKEKEVNVKRERDNLRERIKKFYKDMYNERVEYLKTKSELDELVKQLKDPDEMDDEEEEEEEEEDEEHDPHEDDPGWWFDKPALKPKKLKKKKKKLLNGEEEDEDDEEEEENLEDLSQLEEPMWSDSEGDESDPDDENDALQVRVNFLQSRTKKHEQKMTAIKKDNYMLKTEVEKCKEKHNEEKIRKRRLEEELNMLLSDMQ